MEIFSIYYSEKILFNIASALYSKKCPSSKRPTIGEAPSQDFSRLLILGEMFFIRLLRDRYLHPD